jgi:hypothetical protein
VAISVPNLPYIKTFNRRIYEAIKALQSAAPPTSIPAPPAVSGINVTAANGYFTITLTDNGPVQRGVNYFVEYATDPNFAQPVVLDLGASRTEVRNLGNQTLYWRAYSQYPNSDPNAPVVFGGSTPTGVAGGGAAAPPAVSSTGSGTASTTGQQGGSGMGKVPVRKVEQPF